MTGMCHKFYISGFQTFLSITYVKNNFSSQSNKHTHMHTHTMNQNSNSTILAFTVGHIL